MTQQLLKTLVYIWFIVQTICSQPPEFDCLKNISTSPGTIQKHEYAVNCSESDDACKPTTPPVFFKDQLLRNGKWNATMLTQSHSFKKEISVTFKVMDATRQSGELFEVFLVKLLTDDCNGRQIYQNGHTFLKENLLVNKQIFNYTKETVWTFTGVSPGNYCIKVYPWDCYCIRTLKMGKDCILLNSAVVTVSNVAELIAPISKRDPEFRYWQEDLTSVCLIGSIILAISVCNLLLYKLFKRRRRRRRRPQGNIQLQREEYIEMVTMPPKTEEKAVPFILFCPEEETTKRVSALKKILLAAAEIKINSTQPHLLAIYGGGAVQSMHHSKIIVVETDAAIDLQRKREQIWLSMLYSKNSGDGAGPSTEPLDCDLRNVGGSTNIVENNFVGELTFLTSNLMRSLKDYCHIFVIQFKDLTPNGKFRKLVPNERYVLPDCMLQFCLDLLGEKVDSSVLQENLRFAMEKHWKFDN